MIVRALIYGGIFYLVYRTVRSLTQPKQTRMDTSAGHSGPAIDDIMIKDPVCNVYFPKREGIRLRQGGKDLYFCSEKCRDAYINTHK